MQKTFSPGEAEMLMCRQISSPVAEQVMNAYILESHGIKQRQGDASPHWFDPVYFQGL